MGSKEVKKIVRGLNVGESVKFIAGTNFKQEDIIVTIERCEIGLLVNGSKFSINGFFAHCNVENYQIVK